MVNEETADALRKEIWMRVAQGKKIEAIKMVRALTGGGLKVSKELVESIAELVDVSCPCCGGTGKVNAGTARQYREKML